jgi:hypothetical protein
MGQPFVIWAAERTSGTNLCLALGAENEPFQPGPPASHLAWVYDAWRVSGDAEPVKRLAASGSSFKHVPEEFDDRFNAALARITTAAGYRHVHLVRLDELGRLISLDVAGQLDAWWPGEAKERFAELRSGNRRLNPLDVPRLVKVSNEARLSWQAVSAHLGVVLTLTFEALTTRDHDTRHLALRRLMAFLDLPHETLAVLDRAMITGGQNSAQIRDLVPNIDELRGALA